MKSKDYAKTGTYYLVGNLFNKGIAFLTIIIYTRILTAYDYGIINTFSSWVGILSMILGMSLQNSIRVAFVDFKEKIDDFLSSIISLTLIVGMFLSVLILSVCVFIRINTNIGIVILCLAQSLFTAIIEDYSMYLMMKYRYKLRTLILISPNFLSTVVSVILIVFIMKNNLYLGKIVPTALITVIIALFIIIGVYRNGGVRLNKEYCKYALAISLPLILHSISLNILSQSDRIMITSYAGAAQTGIYSLIYNFSMIASVIISSIEGVWIPWFVLRLKERDIEQINEKAKLYMNIMTYAMVFILLFAEEVLKILATKEYMVGSIIIPPIVLANYVIYAYSLYVNIEHYYKKTRTIAINTMIAAVMNLVLNYIFIPRYGYVAAAFTTLGSYLISFILHYISAKQIEKDLFDIKLFIKPILLIAIGVVCFYVFEKMWYIRWGGAILFFVYVFIKEKEIIVEILNKRK